MQNVQTSVTGNTTASQITSLQATVKLLTEQVATLTSQVSTLIG